jgi:hypothetical protein
VPGGLLPRDVGGSIEYSMHVVVTTAGGGGGEGGGGGGNTDGRWCVSGYVLGGVGGHGNAGGAQGCRGGGGGGGGGVTGCQVQLCAQGSWCTRTPACKLKPQNTQPTYLVELGGFTLR